MTDSREALRDALDEVAQAAIANGVEQTVVREEAEKFADRVRLTEAAAEEIET